MQSDADCLYTFIVWYACAYARQFCGLYFTNDLVYGQVMCGCFSAIKVCRLKCLPILVNHFLPVQVKIIVNHTLAVCACECV